VLPSPYTLILLIILGLAIGVISMVLLDRKNNGLCFKGAVMGLLNVLGCSLQ
jgi:preprotein translocase subunit SecG